jgi:hypothetical protein
MCQVVGPDRAKRPRQPVLVARFVEVSARSGLPIKSGKQVKEKELWRHRGAMVDLWA